MAKEKRLIAASEVKKKLSAIRQYFSGFPGTEQDKLALAVVELCIEEVERIKPVDAVEVVHGRWIEKPNPWGQDGSHSYDCSICGERTCVVGHKLRYCPNCGAKMDGERKRYEKL